MKTWWLALNSREQRLIGSLAGVVLVFIFYSVVWQPLNENIENSQKKLIRQQELLTLVSSETQRYKAEKKSGNNQTSSGSLSSIVNRSAKQQAITITRIQPQNNSVQVWIDNIAFSQLLTWLEALANNEGIQVDTVDLTKGEQPGQVRVKRLQLGKN
jgi:general secretion pathway protein M